MKVSFFSQAAYRELPDDFEQHHLSCVTTPYSLTTPSTIYDSYRDFMDELVHAARCGFDGVAVTEHGQSSYDMMPNPSLIAATLAYLTEVEGLPVAIYPMGRSLGKSREPVRVAEEMAVVDVMSGGRLIAGFPVGLSYDASLNNAVAPIESRERFKEHLALVLRAWEDSEPFAWNGTYSQYPSVNIWPRPLQHPRPPVYLTGTGNPVTMRHSLEADFGFNYFGWFGLKMTGRQVFDRFWDLADQVGVPRNPFRMSFMQIIGVADTDDEARRLYAKHAEYFFRRALGAIPGEMLSLPGATDINGVRAMLRDSSDDGLFAQMKTVTFDQLVEAGCVTVGSPATVREELASYCTEYGIGNLLAMLNFGSLPRELAMNNIQLFADEVLPHLRGIWDESEHEHHWWPERLGGRPRQPTAATLAVRS